MTDTIYCLGDSNTWGYDPRSPWGDRYEKNWCELLGETLSCSTVNDGLNGRTIRDVLRSFSLLEKHLKEEGPRILLILLGSNDILMEGASCPHAASDGMEALLQKLRADMPRLPIFLLSPPPLKIPGLREIGAMTAEYYQALSLRYGTGFLSLQNLSLPIAHDGVHFTEEAHRQLARILSGLL